MKEKKIYCGYVFKCVNIRLVQFHSIELKRGSSYIHSPKWIEKKKATINPQNTKGHYCFAYSIVAALHHEKIGKNPHRIKKPISAITTGKTSSFLQGKTAGKQQRYCSKRFFCPPY